MSEQPSPSNPPEIHPDELAGWEQLAAQSATWPAHHEGLAAFRENHLKRVLAERGLEYLIADKHKPADARVVPSASTPQKDSPLQLVAEEPMPPTTESIASRHEIALSCTTALGILSDITGGGTYETFQKEGPIFERALKAEGVDITDTKDPRYWLTLRKMLSVGDGIWLKSKCYSESALKSLNLLTLTPIAIYAQDTLDHYKAGKKYFRISDLSPEDEANCLENKQLVSEYNGLIRDFAMQNPEVHIDDIRRPIADMLDLFVDFNEQKAVMESIDAILVGAQHESAFGQVLQVLKDEYGYDFRSATAEEDTGQGSALYKGKFFDYVVVTPEGRELLIDVKASKREVENLGITGFIGRRRDGTYVIASGLKPVLAKTGRFFIEPGEARQIADLYENTGMIRDIDEAIARNN